MNISVICTVLNEAQTIEALVVALKKQTLTPKEVVIIDGGSTDGTVEILTKSKDLPFELIVRQKRGNRSVGRNEAIKIVTTELVAITDAGCEPDPAWLEELVKSNGGDKNVVVAGAAKAAPNLTPLQSAMVPYVLVMPDKVNSNTFLPATRSMLLSKSTWQLAGKFDETLSDNEDYAFAKKLEALKKQGKCSIIYSPKAIVLWHPRQTLSQFANMIFRFARGDAFAGIFRPKVIFLFFRYIVFSVLLLFGMFAQNLALLTTLAALCIFYITWSIYKNAKYVTFPALFWLPILQIVSDGRVILGTAQGLFSRTYVSK